MKDWPQTVTGNFTWDRQTNVFYYEVHFSLTGIINVYLLDLKYYKSPEPIENYLRRYYNLLFTEAIGDTEQEKENYLKHNHYALLKKENIVYINVPRYPYLYSTPPINWIECTRNFWHHYPDGTGRQYKKLLTPAYDIDNFGRLVELKSKALEIVLLYDPAQ